MLVVPTHLKAATAEYAAPDSTGIVEIPAVNALLARLDEIALIDKATLRPPERRELRKEVRSIKNQLREGSGGGVYISVGALLIVIILLILLL